MKQRYDENTKDVQYQVGDTVWLYIPATRLGYQRNSRSSGQDHYLLVEQTVPVNSVCTTWKIISWCQLLCMLIVWSLHMIDIPDTKLM